MKSMTKKEAMAALRGKCVALIRFDDFDTAKAVAHAVADGACEKGILICGTGIGMCLAANKVKGIRAALCGDCFSAQMTREHNDANVLCLGARVLGSGLALKIAETFLNTEFSGDERHMRRISKIEE